MKSVCGFVILAIVVSQTTTRFDLPMPATYAFTDLSFSLAFISNMRSGGIATPACPTIRCMSRARSGAASRSGRQTRDGEQREQQRRTQRRLEPRSGTRPCGDVAQRRADAKRDHRSEDAEPVRGTGEEQPVARAGVADRLAVVGIGCFARAGHRSFGLPAYHALPSALNRRNAFR